MSDLRFTNTVTIDRDRADVFAFLSTFENLPLWNYAISHTEAAESGPVRVGARYRQTRTLPRPAMEEFEVTEFEREHRLGIRGTLGPFLAESTYELATLAGATVVTNAMILQPQGAARLLAPLAGSRVRSAVAANLQALKELLEQDAG
jgi:uncharacterized protein YndB with AHSA1/START domain